jgi:hypothetical protein
MYKTRNHTVCSSHRLQAAAKNGGKAKPEMRLPTLIAGALIVPVGILLVHSFTHLVGLTLVLQLVRLVGPS